MKRILIALSGIALLLASCTKGEDYYIEQAPYRKVVDYPATSFTMTVPAGNLTPTESYSWISVSTSGTTATFTVTLNTSGKVRRAEFATSDGKTAVVSQVAHGLKAEVNLGLTGRENGVASMVIDFKPDSENNLSDYSDYGIIVSSDQDITHGTKHSQGSQPIIGSNPVELTGVSDNQAYYVWGYVASPEDMLYSSLLGLVKPLQVASGADLQAAINSAEVFQEVRCVAGGVYAGPIFMRDNVPVTGGWNSSFSAQDYKNKSVIDAGGQANCVFVGVKADGTVFGSKDSKIDNFEIRNGVSTIASGGCGAGIFSKGKLIVSNCYIHDCSAPTGKGGGIYCHEGNNDILVVNCVIERTTNSDGHGGAFWAQGDNISVKLIGNVWDYNECKTTHGYSVLMFQGSTQLVLVNNTIVHNCNWRDTGNQDPDMNDPWATIRIRNGGTFAFAANNIIAGNYYYKYQDYDYIQYKADKGHADPAYRQWQWENGVNYSNIAEAAAKFQSGDGIIWKDMGFDLSTIMKDPENGDYSPVGDALNGDYGSEVQAKVASIFKSYPNDINGNPRVVNGKIAIGALAK